MITCAPPEVDPPRGRTPMRGDDELQGGAFSYITPQARIPKDHPLRAIRTMTDQVLRELSPRFEKIYSPLGRPSIPPEQLLRALLLQILYTVRSERLLMEQLDYNILFRWFVGLSMDDEVWNPTVFSKNRERLLDGDIAQAFFEKVLALARGKSLLVGRALHRRRDAGRGVGRAQELQEEGGEEHEAARRPGESDGGLQR